MTPFAAAVRTPFELVVAHDKPKDTTVPVVERLAAGISGLRAHESILGPGVPNAMQAGIAATQAPFVLVAMAVGSDEYGDTDPMIAQPLEVPTTWRDRTGGESRFRLRKWLPHYLRSYALAFRGRLRRRSRDAAQVP